MSGKAFCTIIAQNYLPLARVLFDSVRKFHPESECFAVVLDHRDIDIDAGESFEVVSLSDLPLELGEEFKFKYQIVELSTALKPYFLEYLLNAKGFEKVVYVDPDVLLVSPLAEVFEALESSNFVLTPHRLTDPRADLMAIRSSLMTGVFNLGFLALKRSRETFALLRWWQTKLFDDCIIKFDKGLFVDQKFMDLSLALFDGGFVLKHPGYNIATWNAGERPLDYREGEYISGKSSVRFFHLSGFRPVGEHYAPEQGWFPLKNPAWKKLLEDYKRRLIGNGWNELSEIPYQYDRFSRWPRLRVHPKLRSLYRNSARLRKRYPKPFDSAFLMMVSIIFGFLQTLGLLKRPED